MLHLLVLSSLRMRSMHANCQSLQTYTLSYIRVGGGKGACKLAPSELGLIGPTFEHKRRQESG